MSGRPSGCQYQNLIYFGHMGMDFTKIFSSVALGAGTSLVLGTAQAATDVSFGTNWLAQAEHGGFYQSVADGTYEECGLNVTIVPGGPQVNNRALMLAGRIDYHSTREKPQVLKISKSLICSSVTTGISPTISG